MCLYEPSPVVNAGKPDRYPLDSVTLDVNSGIYIIHSQEGYFLAQRGVHASGVPHGVETGIGHHCLSLPWQQVQTKRRKDRRSGASAAALEAHLA